MSKFINIKILLINIFNYKIKNLYSYKKIKIIIKNYY